MRDSRRVVWFLLILLVAFMLRAAALLAAGSGSGLHRLAACLAGTAIVPVLAWVGWRLVPGRPSVGWCAAGIAAVYPPHVLLAAAPDGRLWAMLAIVALLAAVLLPGFRATRNGAILAGCLLGLLVPVEPALMAAAPVFAVLFWLAEGDVSWVGRFTLRAAGRLGILLGVAVLVAAPWAAHRHLRTADDSSLQATDATVAASAPAAVARLKAFFLEEGAAHDWTARIDRVASMALWITAALGLYLSGPAWRTLWPAHAIVGLSLAMYLMGVGTPALRATLEPISFVWAAWTLSMLPIRGDRPSKIRVYRPGENAHDPFEGPHVLHGPHYNAPQRRRAG